MVLQTGAFLGTTKKIFVGISTECLPVFWGTSPDTPGHLNVKETSLEQVIKELEKQTGLQFFYSQDKIEKITGLSLQAKQEDFKTILDRLLKNTVLTFTVMDDVVVIKDREKTVSPLQSAIREIKGVVTDVQGNTLPGVTVRIKGTTLGGITDTEGAFQLSLPEGKQFYSFLLWV